MISSVNYNPKILKLRKWIPIDKVYWDVLSSNPMIQKYYICMVKTLKLILN
jgi:hypothetical protein